MVTTTTKVPLLNKTIFTLGNQKIVRSRRNATRFIEFKTTLVNFRLHKFGMIAFCTTKHL